MSASTRKATSWDDSRSAYRNTPRPTLSPRTATTATDIATMDGCSEARASRNPDTASSATPQPVAAAPASTENTNWVRSGRASHSRRSSGRRDGALTG